MRRFRFRGTSSQQGRRSRANVTPSAADRAKRCTSMPPQRYPLGMLMGAELAAGTVLLLWVSYMAFVATPAAVITALKGQWLWFALGFCTAGIAWLVGAVQEPKHESVWHRRSRARAGRS